MSNAEAKDEKVKRISQLTVINPTAAGIDVSDTEMMGAFPVNSEQLEVRAFGCFTRDLHSISLCLKEIRSNLKFCCVFPDYYWKIKVTEGLCYKNFCAFCVLFILKYKRNKKLPKDTKDRKMQAFRFLSALRFSVVNP